MSMTNSRTQLRKFYPMSLVNYNCLYNSKTSDILIFDITLNAKFNLHILLYLLHYLLLIYYHKFTFKYCSCNGKFCIQYFIVR